MTEGGLEAFELLPVGVALLDEGGNLASLNRSLRQMLDGRHVDVVGRPLGELVAHPALDGLLADLRAGERDEVSLDSQLSRGSGPDLLADLVSV